MEVLLTARQKFASQADPALLAEMRAIAEEEGRQLQAVLEEAMRDLIAKRRGVQPRAEVLAHLEATVEENRELYRRLAQ
jgi:serine kinase of HPr protein (carbohydrate metabolism regulator)